MFVRLAGTLGAPDHWVTIPLLGAFPWFATWALVVAVVCVVLWRRSRATWRTAVAALVVASMGLVLLVPRTVASTQPVATG